MKINMYGGVLTISYNLAKFLRRKNQDVTLFVDKELIDRSYSPVWEDEDLANRFPEWIKVTDVKFGKFLLRGRKTLRFKELLTDCDILHLHGEAYLWANIFSKRFIYHSYGYDLDQMPFRKDTIHSRILSFFSRRSIKRAEKIIIVPHQNIFLERLKVKDRGIYLPFPVDLEKYRRLDVGELRKTILSSYEVNFIFFHPTRHEWLNNLTTNNKGNDKVIFAFASYIKNSRNKSVLILVNKGRDVAESKKLIKKLNLDKYVIWLEPMRKAKLIEYYNVSDIVLDQFNIGSIGQIFLESMACGKPTFIYLKGYEEYYEELPPVINVFSSDDMVSEMIKLTDNHDYRVKIGNKSREWILKYHDWNVVTDKYISLYEEILGVKKAFN